jgi:hypothetical protein
MILGGGFAFDLNANSLKAAFPSNRPPRRIASKKKNSLGGTIQ